MVRKTMQMCVAVLAVLVMVGSARAGIIVTPDHISTGSAVGTLMAVDVPYSATLPYTGGPDWPTDADDGFLVVNHAVQETWGNGKWEPDGTPQAENRAYQVYPSASPNVTYTFDIPDGSTINAVYATWAVRSRLYARYHYSEGAASDTVDVVQSINPTTDLGLDWTDDAATVRTAPFQLLFNSSVTVTGGDGFTVAVDRYQANAASIDAVVIDYTPVPEPATMALLGLGGLLMVRRRRI